MRAYDFRSQARWALKGKWKLMTGIMLLAQLVFGGFALGDIAQNFFSRDYVIAGEMLGVEGMNLAYALPYGFGWVLFGFGQAIMLVFSSVTYIGIYRVSADVLDGKTPRWQQLFPMKLFFKALWMNILRSLLVFVQLLLFIVPGIIAAFRYTMADYLLAENPDLGPFEALKLSSKHMKGNKARLFCLYFSFTGWALLASLVPMGVILLLVGMPAQLLMVAELIISWLCSCVLNVYTFTAETAFFRDILHGSVKRDWREANRQAWIWEQQDEDEEEPAEEESAPQSRADEAKAREMYLSYRCSMEMLRRAGMAEEYEQLNPSHLGEDRWRHDYAQLLMRRFDRDPDALDELLSLSAEYALDDLADRTLQRIDRHIRQETLPLAQVLDMAGRLLAMLLSGAFAGNEGFISRKKVQIADMADRLEQKLLQDDSEGPWRKSMELLRSMCG